MDSITAFIISTAEYRQWGWNIATVAFIVTTAMTFGLQMPGLIDQALKIFRNQSAQGVEFLTALSLVAYFAVFLLYGLSAHTAAGIINAVVLLLPAFGVVAGITLFKKEMRASDMFATFVAWFFVTLTIVWPYKELSYMIITGVVLVGLTLQPREMIRTKTSQNVALSFPFTFAIVCATWTLYGFAIGDWFVASAAAAFGIIYVWTAVLWFRYRNNGRKIINETIVRDLGD